MGKPRRLKLSATANAPQARVSRTYDPNRVAPYARALLASIKTELAGVDFFTREDLLHLEAIDYISTISRYSYVRAVVHMLLDNGSIVRVGESGTEFSLPGKVRNGVNGASTLAAEYRSSIMRLVRGIGPNQLFSVMDIVHKWRTDPHLTENTKRVITRRLLAEFVRDKTVVKEDFHTFYLKEPQA